MLSAFIPSGRSYPAMLLAKQLVHRRSVHSGPLVLGAASLMYLTPAMDMDRTVSRRSEPSSRTTLMGEQPNPWDLLQPQDLRQLVLCKCCWRYCYIQPQFCKWRIYNPEGQILQRSRHCRILVRKVLCELSYCKRHHCRLRCFG